MISIEEKMCKERIRGILEENKKRNKKERSDEKEIDSVTAITNSESERVMFGRQINGEETHISFKVLYRVLDSFPKIDANWLIMGEGTINKADHIAPRIYNQHNEVHNNTAGGDINVGPDTIVTSKTVDTLQAIIDEQRKRIAELEEDKTLLKEVISNYLPKKK